MTNRLIRWLSLRELPIAIQLKRRGLISSVGLFVPGSGFTQIAVHCHAGYGRTGLVIASILVMMKNLTAQQAVALVREKRPTSVQTPAQVKPFITKMINDIYIYICILYTYRNNNKAIRKHE